MQLAITDLTPIRARRTDPATSHRAAADSVRFAGSHAGRILESLKQHGAQSPKELERRIGLSVVQIDRRACELRRAGLIEVVTTDDGAEVVREGCRVWRAVDKSQA